MKTITSNTTTKHVVINDKLREIPVDMASMQSGIAEIKKFVLDEDDEVAKARWMSQLGYYQNIVGEHDVAQANLQQALKLFRKHGLVNFTIVAKLRMAQVLQYSGDLEMALAIVDALEEELEDEYVVYHDFILQHKGKILFDMKAYDPALECLNDALTIRKEKGDKALIDSTRYAMKVVVGYLP
jgi:HTH-type transcriptional regulator, pleiotropic regulator of extracellular virulence genes